MPHDASRPTSRASGFPGWQTPRSLELPSLPMTVVEVRARSVGNAPLPPYLGTTLRGSLGQALREGVCVTGASTCDGCELIRRCPYGATWEAKTPPGVTGPLARGEWPRPYVITAERAPELLLPGGTLDFRLVLVGWAKEFLAHYLASLIAALRTGLGPQRAPFEVERAVTLDVTGGRGPNGACRDGRGLVLVADGQLVRWEALPDTTLWGLVHRGERRLEGRVSVRIATPMHLVSRGRPMTQIDPEAIVSRLCERIDRLQLAWGPAGAPLLDFEALATLAREALIVRVDTRRIAFDRASTRAGRVPMSGIVGRFVLDDVHPAVAAVLAAGEWLHVGKQSTFGFGRLVVEQGRRGRRDGRGGDRRARGGDPR